MAGTRTQNTMSEGLRKVLEQIAGMKAEPDADLDILSTLESQILETLRAPYQQAMNKFSQAGGVVPPGMQGGPPGQGGPTPGGQMPMPVPPMPGGGGAPGGGPPPGVRNGGNMPPVDELRRLIASESLA